MKILVVLLIFAIYCIDATGTCGSNSCNSCLASNDCVWCDNRCVSKKALSLIACESRITSSLECKNEKKYCEHNGQKYSVGETFMNECNTCTCNRGGLASCTEMACFQGCEAVLCEEGTTCFIEYGVATCKPNNPCALMECADLKACYVDHEGNAQCCDDPCMTARCGFDTICVTTQDCSAQCVKPTCDYNGHTFYHGESFPSDDSCNQCFCSDGIVGCTLRFCVQLCEYKGQTHIEGDSFNDECNTCRCLSGQVACTRMACLPNPITCETNIDCDPTFYCAKANCEDMGGTCTRRQEMCTAIYDPVCSCNNITYGSACTASSSGENVKREGEC